MVKVRGKRGGKGGNSTNPPLKRTFPSKNKGKIQKLQKTKSKGGSNKKGLRLPSDSFLKMNMEKLNLGYCEGENDSRKAVYRSAYLLVHAISYAWKPLSWKDDKNGPDHLSKVTFENLPCQLNHSAGENALMARQHACYDLIKYLSCTLNFIDPSLYVRCLFEHRHYGALGCIIANMLQSFKKGYGSEMKDKKGDKKKLDESTKQARAIYNHTKEDCEKRIIELLNNTKIKSEQLILDEGDESNDILIRIKKEVEKARDEYLNTNDVIVVDPSECKKSTKVKFISSDEESEEEVKPKRNEMKKIPIDINKVKKEKISDNECEITNSSFTLMKEVKREKIDEDEKKKKKIKEENVEDMDDRKEKKKNDIKVKKEIDSDELNKKNKVDDKEDEDSDIIMIEEVKSKKIKNIKKEIEDDDNDDVDKVKKKKKRKMDMENESSSESDEDMKKEKKKKKPKKLMANEENDKIDKKKIKKEKISDDDENEEGNTRRCRSYSLMDISEGEDECIKLIRMENDACSSSGSDYDGDGKSSNRIRVKTRSACSSRAGSSIDLKNDHNEMDGDGIHSDFQQFRAALSKYSTTQWEFLADIYKFKSSLSTISTRYKLSCFIIQYLNETFGDDFLKILHLFATIQFTPSDLKDENEVIGLIMFLDRRKFIRNNFLGLLLVLNDMERVKKALTIAMDCIRARVNYFLMKRREKFDILPKSEVKEIETKAKEAEKELKGKYCEVFGDIVKIDPKKENEAGSKLRAIEEKMAKLYADCFFNSNCKLFGLKNTMTKRDLSKAAIMVCTHVNELLNGQLPEIAFMNSSIDRESWSEENKLTAYSGLLVLNKKMLFPKGMLFLLLQCRNEQTIKNVCIELRTVIDVFFKLLEAENNGATKQLTDLQDRMKQLHNQLFQVYRHHFGNLIKTVPKSIVYAATNLEKEPIVKKVDKNVSKLSICSSPFDESEWSFISSFGVTTIWKRSDEFIEWEKKHQSEIDRLSQKIDDHTAATVTREDDYQEKLGAFNIIKECLNEIMNDTDTLHMVGSSLSNFAPHNSNLDILVCRKNKSTFADIAECLLKSDQISSDGKDTMFCIKMDRSTIRCHINYELNTLYMAHVYCVMDLLDDRIAPLVLLLKAWRILDHKSNHLGSYHIITLLIHYLQCGVSPPVLPSLNFLYPRLDPKSFQSYDTHLPSDNAPKSENIQSVASLLIGFFIYFSNFNFEKYIISIREGHVLKRLNPSKDDKKRAICESPYDQGVRQVNNTSLIRSAMKDAANDLITSFKLSTIKTL